MAPNRVSSQDTGARGIEPTWVPVKKSPMWLCGHFSSVHSANLGPGNHLKVDRNSSHQVTSCVKWLRIW